MKRILKKIFLSIAILVVILVAYFFTVKKLNQSIVEEGYSSVEIIDHKTRLIPSQFIDGERFYIKIPLKNGGSILGFCDTGGGISMIQPPTVEKKELTSILKTGLFKGVMPLDYILSDDLIGDEEFPRPCALRSFVIRHPVVSVSESYFIIPPMDEEVQFIMESMPLMEAFLGQSYFMGKSWTFDYLREEIWINTPLEEGDLNPPQVQEVGFKKDDKKENIYGHGSMNIEVEGERIPVLFDTGASLVLTEEGKKELNTNSKTIGGSFIAVSVFDKWQEKHPDWKVYSRADKSGDVIEVPIVNVGGFDVGPVLFAKRNDENWSEGMIHTMDKVVKGAIGGSALKYLKVTIDYNSELIKFER